MLLVAYLDDGDGGDGGGLVVAGLHGLTKRPLVTSLAALQRSNAQLNEINPDEASWITPTTKLNLANRLILLS